MLEVTTENGALKDCGDQLKTVLVPSRALTFLMVKYLYTLDLGSDFYDEVLLKNTVLKQVENIQNKGGVRTKGWVKASNSQTKSEQASMELK